MNTDLLNPILEKQGLRITETKTTPTRPGKLSRPVWVVSGNTFGLESFFYEIGGKRYRGAWSFFNDPSVQIAKELETNGRQSFAEQVEGKLDRDLARAERFEQYADNANKRSLAAQERVTAIASHIPMGQPILVGHYSERRHRKDLKRIDRGMQKSIEESKKSDYYNRRASFLEYKAERASSNPQFIANRIKEAAKEVKQLKQWTLESLSPSNQEDLTLRLANANEKLRFWNKRLEAVNASLTEAGKPVPSHQSIKVGDEIYYCVWLPVIRINRKTVTVSHWLGVPTMTYKIEYTRIRNFRLKAKQETLEAAAEVRP